jgi:type IV pilus assembly protein PilO
MEEQLKNITVGKSLLIGLALGAGYYFMMYNDGSAIEAQIGTVQQQIAAAESEVASVRKAIEDAERYQQTMSTLGSEMERVQKAMPSKLNTTDLMKVISTEAKAVGAEINQLSANEGYQTGSPETEERYYDEVPVQVEITGTYGQVMLFLSNLTKLDKIVTAKKLELTILQGGVTKNRVPSISLKSTLQAYKYVSVVKKPEGGG